MPEWVWLDSSHRYHDLTSGRFVSAEQVRDWSHAAADASGDAATEFARMLDGGQLTLGDWQTVMREEIKDAYVEQYLLGIGGLDNMTQQTWGSVGGMLAEQYHYLDGFAREIATGRLTEGQIARRARMYTNSAVEARSRAHARALGMPELPDYPGSGNTVCMTACRCAWEIEEVKDDTGNVVRWNCIWQLNPAEHCTSDESDAQGRPRGCIQRAALWNPLVIEA